MKKLINFIAIVTLLGASCLSFAMDMDASETAASMDTKADSKKRKAVAAAYQSRAKRLKKSFNCTECNKVFDKKNHLERHMIIHTGEKPFKCSQCDRAFSDKSNLTQHIHTHTSGKPKKKSAKKTLFNCPKCDKAFSRRDTLDRHMHTHTGETSFKCSTCDKTFKSKHGLAGHRNACERKPLASINKATATPSPSILSQRESSLEVPVAAIVVSRNPSSSDTQSSSTGAGMQSIAMAALVPAKEITLPVQDDWEFHRKDLTAMDIQ